MPESPADAEEIEVLYDLVFGPGRKALSSYRLRAGAEPIGKLGMVSREREGLLVGAIRFWPVRLGAGGIPALLAGPVGIHPTRQGEGLGAALIRRALSRAAICEMPLDAGEAGCWSRAVLVGDEPYYGRFGFRRCLGEGLNFPPPTDPRRVLACELKEGAMHGVEGDVCSWGVLRVR